MVSPVRGDYRRLQAETPLIDLSKFAEPALAHRAVSFSMIILCPYRRGVGCCASTVSGRLRQNVKSEVQQSPNDRHGASTGFPADLGIKPIGDCGRFVLLLLHRLQFQFSIKTFARHIPGVFISRDRCLRVVVV
jgi:hypothetical protein